MSPNAIDDDEHERPVTKPIMDAPQEEFIAPESVPSQSASSGDKDHGDEVPEDQPAEKRE